MGNSVGAIGGDERESAAFVVSVADYRRAFAMAVASSRSEGPSFRAMFRPSIRKNWWSGTLVGLIGGVVWGAWVYSRG
jgi:hypothetical protein